MYRKVSSLSPFTRRLPTASYPFSLPLPWAFAQPPARLATPPPLPPLLPPCHCFCRYYTSSSSSPSDTGSHDEPGPTRPHPPRLLTHSSPLDLMTNLASCGSADSPSANSNTQTSILDQLGVKLDPNVAAHLSARRHHHRDGGVKPKPKRDIPGSSHSSSPSHRRSSHDREMDSASFVSSSAVSAKHWSHGDRPRFASTAPTTRSSSPQAPGPARSLDRWDPLKKLPRSTMDRLRFLHAQDPKTFSVRALSTAYGIGYESVKRILRSKFVPEPERAKQMDARRAQLKDEWRAKQARQVRDRLAKERSEKEKEREVVLSKSRNEQSGHEAGKGQVNNKGGNYKNTAVTVGDDGWDWLAKTGESDKKGNEGE